MPYLWDTDGDGKFDDWANPKSFQIISAGLDDNYGAWSQSVNSTPSRQSDHRQQRSYT